MAAYYVEVGGGTGLGTSPVTAWSYAKLNATPLVAGDIVYFRKGETFNGALTVRNGTAGNPVTYTTLNGYGTGANPIISGFTTLGGWTLSSGNIWYASLDVPMLHGVTIDGNVRGMGRYPNTGYLVYSGTNGTITPYVQATNISGTTVGAIPFDPTGAEVVIRKYRWVLDRHVVTNRSGNTLNFSNGNYYSTNAAYNAIPGNGYFIQNHIGCLDQDGDWCYDNPANRVYLYSTTNPNSRVIKASALDIVVLFNARAYVNFTGIDFEGGNYSIYTLSGTNNITFTNCNFRQQGGNAAVVTDSSDITFNGGSVTDSLNTGMLFSATTGVTVSGMTITNSGMIPGAAQNADGGYQGIRCTGGSANIVNNRIINSGYCGIYHIGSNFLAEHNFVSGHGSVKDDSGGIYTVNSSGVLTSNIIIRNNIVINGIGAQEGTAGDPNQEFYGKASGIYLDDNSNNVIVANNFISGMPWAGIVLHRAYSIQVTNNTVFDTLESFNIIDEIAATRGLVVTGNKFIAKTSTQKTVYVEMFTSDNPALYGNFNNNYYARPIAEGNTISVKAPNGSISNMSLTTWKVTYGLDSNTLASQFSVNNVNEFRTEYNDTLSTVTRSLGAVYKDIANATYNGSAVLTPFDGDVYVYSSAIVPVEPPPIPPNKILKSPSGKILVRNGKILMSA